MKRRSIPMPFGKSRALELRVLQALFQEPNSQNFPSNKQKQQNKPELAKSHIGPFSVFMRKPGTQKHIEFLSYVLQHGVPVSFKIL